MTPRRGIRPLLSLRNQVAKLRDDEITHLTRQVRILGTFLVVALLLMTVPSLVAWAAPASQPATQTAAQNTQQWWMPLLTPVLTAIGTLLAAFVTVLLGKLIKMLEAKYNLDIPAEVEKIMENKAKELVAAAEEEAERRILHEGGQPTSGAEKSKQVVKGLMEFAESLGYGKQYQEEQARRLADAVLHLNRVGMEGVGSVGERAKALTRATRTDTSNR